MITAESPLSHGLYTIWLWYSSHWEMGFVYSYRIGQVCDFSGFDNYVTLKAGSQGDKLPSASLGTLVFGGLGPHYVIKATPLCQATWWGHKGMAHSPRWVPRWQPADAIGVKTPPSDSCLPLSHHCSWVLPVEALDIIEKKQTAHCAFSELLTHRICKQN